MLISLSHEEVTSLWNKWFRDKGSSEAYEWIRPKGVKKLWPKVVWKSFIPPKYSFITWQAVRGRLYTRDRLTYLNIDQSCPLCLVSPESCQHLFFLCPRTNSVWLEIKKWLGLRRNLSSIPSAIKWIHKERRPSVIHDKARRIALAATVSFIWRARNAFIFDKAPFDPATVVFNIKKTTYTCLFAMFPHEVVTCHLCG